MPPIYHNETSQIPKLTKEDLINNYTPVDYKKQIQVPEISPNIQGFTSNTNEQHKFKKSFTMGKLGVAHVTWFLHVSNIASYVYNGESDDRVQSCGCDLIIVLNPNHPYSKKLISKFKKDVITIEVKTDAQDRTGNLAAEIYSNIERGKAGWVQYCKADLLFYYYINSGLLCTFITEYFRDFTMSLENYLNPEFSRVTNSLKGTRNKDLLEYDFLFLPDDVPYESTKDHLYSHKNGNRYSLKDRSGKSKKYPSREHNVYALPQLLEYLGVKETQSHISAFKKNVHKQLKMYRIGETHAQNEVSRGISYHSRCLLVSAELYKNFGIELEYFNIKNAISHELYPINNFDEFGKGGKKIKKNNGQSDFYDFSEKEFLDIMKTFYYNIGQYHFSSTHFKNYFDYNVNQKGIFNL